MSPEPNDVYEAYFRYGKVDYPRPCVITGKIVSGRVTVMAISSEMDLFKGLPGHFAIEETDPDFPHTGLKRTSFINLDDNSEIGLHALIRKRGRIEGDLQKRLWKLI